MVDYFYQSGAMGYYGEGWFWHKLVKPFPKNIPIITKTITKHPINRVPIVIPFGKSVWNKVGLVNPGIDKWIQGYFDYGSPENLIISLYGTDEEIQNMICTLYINRVSVLGVELNFSCPNAKNKYNRVIPYSVYPLYLKLNHTQNPLSYDMGAIRRLHVNSVPMYKGAISGKKAQSRNWVYIKKWLDVGINIAGCSFTSLADVHKLRRMGCKSIGIGAATIVNPKLVRYLLWLDAKKRRV